MKELSDSLPTSIDITCALNTDESAQSIAGLTPVKYGILHITKGYHNGYYTFTLYDLSNREIYYYLNDKWITTLNNVSCLSGYLRIGSMNMNLDAFTNYLLVIDQGLYFIRTYASTFGVNNIVNNPNISFAGSTGLIAKVTLSNAENVYFTLLKMGGQQGKNYTDSTINL